MIIVLLDSEKASDNRSLTVNINRYDSFIIQKKEEGQFQLALQKIFDGHFSNQSNILYILVVFGTYEKCYDLFEAIMEDFRKGEKVFSVKEFLEKNALKYGDHPEV